MSKMSDVLAKATKKQKMNTTDRMRANGYLSPGEVAEKLGMHLGSVYRWVEENNVDTLRVLGKRFIKKSSLIEKLGLEQARIFGFLDAPAAPVKK